MSFQSCEFASTYRHDEEAAHTTLPHAGPICGFEKFKTTLLMDTKLRQRSYPQAIEAVGFHRKTCQLVDNEHSFLHRPSKPSFLPSSKNVCARALRPSQGEKMCVLGGGTLVSIHRGLRLSLDLTSPSNLVPQLSYSRCFVDTLILEASHILQALTCSVFQYPHQLVFSAF